MSVLSQLFRFMCLCISVAISCVAVPAHGQEYPTKTIRMLNPLPAGGPTDILGRIIAQPVSEALGKQIVTDNRPGAAGNIAAEMAAKAAPDGYTLFIAGVGNFAVNVTLFSKLPPADGSMLRSVVNKVQVVGGYLTEYSYFTAACLLVKRLDNKLQYREHFDAASNLLPGFENESAFTF